MTRAISRIEIFIARIFWLLGLTRLVLAWNRYRGKVPIVIYHSIRPKPGPGQKMPMVWQTETAVSPETFEEQIRFFTSRYQCVSLREYLEASERNDPEVKRMLVITFDDGYIDNLETAVPILRRYGASATFYLIGSHLEGERPSPVALYNIVHDRSSPQEAKAIRKIIDRENLVRSGMEALKMSAVLCEEDFGRLEWQSHFISREQARKMHAEGFEIGAHGYYHLAASALEAGEFKEDAVRARQAVSGAVGEPRPGFAYPFGINPFPDEGPARAIVTANFDYAVTSKEGLNGSGTDRYRLRRISMDEIPLHVVRFRLTGLRAGLKTVFQRLKRERLNALRLSNMGSSCAE